MSKKIEGIGVPEVWYSRYLLAKAYYEEFGNLLIPTNYTVYDDEGNLFKLGIWISTQRSEYKEKYLSKEQISLLKKIKMVWNVYKNDKVIPNSWMKYYNFAKEYYKNHKNLLIPVDYVVYDKNKKPIKLGGWILTQRARYKNKTLNKKQISLLKKIKMEWSILKNEDYISHSWMEAYNFAKKYYNKHKNLQIPYDYVVITKEGKKINLGRWLSTQRYAYRNENSNNDLNAKKISLLEKIGIEWDLSYVVKASERGDKIPAKWMKKYKLAQKFFLENEHLRVPRNYMIKDENGEKVNLYSWIRTQRHVYSGKMKGVLNTKQIDLLNDINMIWHPIYYNELVKKIEEDFYFYQYGLLDEKNIEALVNDKYLEYSESKEIVKGNALVLARNKK